MSTKRITPEHIRQRKKADNPLVCLTAYTTSIAKIADRYCDVILTGDSLGMVLYGLEDTTGVTLDMMVRHGRGVVKGAAQACVVVDMPFGTYEDSPEQALKTARHIMYETGCDAVKLEGGADMAANIKAITGSGIAVMGHIGLLPQSAPAEGGFKIKGRGQDQIEKMLNDARAVEEAGAFAFVIEGTIAHVAEEITNHVDIPTIGIGASLSCDGQILVTEDMLGLTERPPKFVKQYASLQKYIGEAVKAYAEDVRKRRFPGKEHLYNT